jgi:hypothetical protein
MKKIKTNENIQVTVKNLSKLNDKQIDYLLDSFPKKMFEFNNDIETEQKGRLTLDGIEYHWSLTTKGKSAILIFTNELNKNEWFENLALIDNLKIKLEY